MRAPIHVVLVVAILSLGVGAASAQTAKEREAQGRAYLAAGRWDDAIVELQAALAAEPRRIAVLFALARAYEGKGDEQLALDTYARYPETGPDAEEAKEEIARLTALLRKKNEQRAEARATQGKEFHEDGAYDQAIAEYLEAFRLSPKPIYYFEAGQSYEAKGDKRKAIELYLRYIDAEPRGARAAEAQRLIARHNRDLVNETTAGARKVDAEVAARQAREAAATARRSAQSALDESRARNDAEAASRLEAARAAAGQARSLADLAERAAQAAGEAARVAGTTGARRDAELAAELAAAARQSAAEASASVSRVDGLTARSAAGTLEGRGGRAAPGRPLRWSGLGIAAGGAACVAAGVLFGVQARNASDDVSAAGGQWRDGLDERIDDGESAERRMFIAYGVGGGLLVAGAALYYLGWRSGEREPPDAQALRWAPIVDASGAGVAVGGRF